MPVRPWLLCGFARRWNRTELLQQPKCVHDDPAFAESAVRNHVHYHSPYLRSFARGRDTQKLTAMRPGPRKSADDHFTFCDLFVQRPLNIWERGKKQADGMLPSLPSRSLARSAVSQRSISLRILSTNTKSNLWTEKSTEPNGKRPELKSSANPGDPGHHRVPQLTCPSLLRPDCVLRPTEPIRL